MTDILLLSGHDYRSPRRVNVHFIAEAAARAGARVSFFSVGFSVLSRIKGDPRKDLASRANRWEQVDGVDCYLWKTALHPVNLKLPMGDGLLASAYRAYADLPCPALDEAARRADTILVESGMGPLFLRRLRALAPQARFVYIASDLLSTIRVHPVVQAELDAGLDGFDLIQVPARAMIPAFAAARDRVGFIPHAIDAEMLAADMPNPYGPGRHVVSVGSMLFDPSFFEHAAAAFPDVTFHVIGARGPHDLPGNVIQYPETPFEQTLPYIRHADAGVAPYRHGPSASYLADSSMKLGQYGHLGIPAICPHFAVGDYPGRFGYEPGDADSIASAVGRALAPDQPVIRLPHRTWHDVAREILLSIEPAPPQHQRAVA